MRDLYASDRKLYLRKQFPDHSDLRRLRKKLTAAQIIRQDPDYGRRTYRVLANNDGAAEVLCCLGGLPHETEKSYAKE